jgi:hypothetical protein
MNLFLIKDSCEDKYAYQLFYEFLYAVKQFKIAFNIANHFPTRLCKQIFSSFQFVIHKDLIHSRISKLFFDRILSVFAVHSIRVLCLQFCCYSSRFIFFGFPKISSCDLFLHFRT